MPAPRTAVFGGTFDPPHLGHCVVLREILDLPGIRSVLVIPTAQSPLKGPVRATGEQRLALTKMALEEYFPKELADGRLQLLDIEIARGRKANTPTYTYDTVQELKALGHSNLTLIIGTDQLADLPRWHRFQDLIKQTLWIVLTRQGFSPEMVATGLKALPDSLKSQFRILPTMAPALASTDIREAAAKTGEIPENTVTPSVARQLKVWGLYGIGGRS